VSSSSAAAYITGMVRGATKSLVIDMAFLLEGQSAHELPETLIGGMRLHHLDLAAAKMLDTSRELPLLQPSHSRRGAELLQPRSMTGNHSRKNSSASDLDLAADALKGRRLGKAAPAAAPRSPAAPPVPQQPAQAPQRERTPPPQQQQGQQQAQQQQQQQQQLATPPPRRHTSAADGVLAGAARVLAKVSPSQPIKVAAAAAADLPHSADAIKSSSYPGMGPLAAAAGGRRAAAAASPGGELLQDEAAAGAGGDDEPPGSAGRSSGGGGRIKQFMQRHIRKLSGGSDADWAGASYSSPPPPHMRKGSVSSLNLGY
jgi:hypothetical protein